MNLSLGNNMFYRGFIQAVVLSLCNGAIAAQSLPINPSHPSEYVVRKGDTLWDISAKFLQNPWQWPMLWENNQQIKNPHLIYPGDILHFSVQDGQPRLSLSPGTVKIEPEIRESNSQEAIPYIPSDAITQFLTTPKIVGPSELDQAPYVIDFAGEHLIAGAGDRVYVRSITRPRSLNYTIYRQGQAYVSPHDQAVLGYEAVFVADTTLQSPGDPATLFVNKSDREIRKGDRLMVSSAGELALNYYPRAPDQDISGNIISVLNGVTQIGQHNVVVIDKGKADGVETGHVFDIYRRGRVVKDPYLGEGAPSRVRLPEEIAGVLMVFRPFEKVSYALIMDASAAIHVMDIIRSP